MLRTLTAIAAGCLFLASCSYEATTLIADPYWWTIQTVERDLRNELARAARDMGYRLKVVVLEPDAEGRVSMGQIPLDAAARVLILSPLLGVSQTSLVAEHPDRRFILLDASEDEYPANAVPVTYDRSEAYREAGREAARLAQEARKTGIRVPATAVAYVGSVERQNELEDFMNAFSDQASAGLLHVCRIYDPNDRERVRACLREADVRAATVYLASAAAQNGFLLEELRGRDVRVIAENHALAPAFPETVAYSVEIDAVAAVQAGLGGLSASNGEGVVVPARLVATALPKPEGGEDAAVAEPETR
jgi:hypothetical protein